MQTGPLGSTIHVLRADAGTIAELVCEAVDGVRLSVTIDEWTSAVTRIVRRRRRASVHVREEATPYAGRPG